jgi:hypothetical protein
MMPSEYAYFALVAFDPREWLGLVLPSESKEAERAEPPVRSLPGQKQKKQPKLAAGKEAGKAENKQTDSKIPTTVMLELPSSCDGASKIVVRCDELFKFGELLAHGDIAAVELLYSPTALISSREWEELQGQRSMYARTRMLLSHYIGLPRQQLLRRTLTVEWANVFRWLYEAERLYAGLEPQVFWTAAFPAGSQQQQQAEHLRSLQPPVTAHTDSDLRARATAILQALEERFAAEKNQSAAERSLPNHIPKDVVSKWMQRIRLEMLRSSMPRQVV